MKAVQMAMEDAGISSAEDVHFVQIKCPLLTSQRMEEARERGATVRVRTRSAIVPKSAYWEDKNKNDDLKMMMRTAISFVFSFLPKFDDGNPRQLQV